MQHVVQTKRRSWNIDEYREKALRREEERSGGKAVGMWNVASGVT